MRGPPFGKLRGRAFRSRRQRRRCRLAAVGAADRKPTMPTHEWPHRRQFNFVVLADQRPVGLFAERQAATGAMRRRMILKGVGVFAETARVTFMPGLGPAGLGVLALVF